MGVALPLALVAFVLSPARRTVLLLGGLALLGVTLALGASPPLYAVLNEVVPSSTLPRPRALAAGIRLRPGRAGDARGRRPASGTGPRGAGAAERGDVDPALRGGALRGRRGLAVLSLAQQQVGAIQCPPQPRRPCCGGRPWLPSLLAWSASSPLGLAPPPARRRAGPGAERGQAGDGVQPAGRPWSCTVSARRSPPIKKGGPPPARRAEEQERQGGRGTAPVPERVVSLAVEERLDPERLRRPRRVRTGSTGYGRDGRRS